MSCSREITLYLCLLCMEGERIRFSVRAREINYRATIQPPICVTKKMGLAQGLKKSVSSSRATRKGR